MESVDVEKFGILLFESLNDSEPKTGKILSEEILRYKQFEEKVLSVEYFDINNKSEFISHLSSKVDEAISHNHYYFVHFEIHGFNGGIELKNNEKISWKEIFPFLRKLNLHYKNYLILYLGVCKGASLIQFIDPSERAPFRSIVASAHNIKSHDLLIGFEAFYTKFFFSFDIPLSLEEFNKTIKHQKSKLHLITSEYCFDQMCDMDRSTADHKGLDSIILENLKKAMPHFGYLKKKEQTKYIAIEKKRIADECKANRDFFLMNDLDEIQLPSDKETT